MFAPLALTQPTSARPFFSAHPSCAQPFWEAGADRICVERCCGGQYVDRDQGNGRRGGGDGEKDVPLATIFLFRTDFSTPRRTQTARARGRTTHAVRPCLSAHNSQHAHTMLIGAMQFR